MTNKFFKRAGIAATAAALAFGAAAANATTYTDTFQGVTFNITAVDSNTFNLQILNALTGGSGDWLNISQLGSFSLKQEGADVDTGSITNMGGWTFDQHELNAAADGCSTNGNTKNACFKFTPRLNLTDSMTFTIDVGGTGIDTAGIWHLKIAFFCSSTATDKCGSLYSKDIERTSTSSTSSTSSSSSGDEVPEPGTLSLTLLGLGLLGAGFMRRAKQSA